MSFLDTIRDVLRGSKKLASADLAKSVADLEGQLPGMRAKIGEIERERARILVEAGDRELAAIEERLAAAKRDLDRGEALLAELQRREGEAREQEAAAALVVERRKLEAEAQAIVKQRLGERRKLEDQLREMILAEIDCNKRIHAFNDVLITDCGVLGTGKRQGEALIKTANDLMPEEGGSVWPKIGPIWQAF
jgi:hypothetical protein